ncbi:hypothetical protein AURDEDRAFT_186731 [Auricularia subglabra TFB-10046 SS5]|nr:hypothetical protein AURDEDRAFT_186731 [Auricularia subglabra TFB-10046 SS5]
MLVMFQARELWQLGRAPGKFILADTQQLHEKIDAMSKRIAELEDALAALQSQISDEKHPLLSDDLVLVKAPPLTQDVSVAALAKEATDKLAENFGTLTLGERANFFGQHAAADYVITEESQLETPASTVSLPLDILLLAGSFPTTNIRDTRCQVAIELATWLPSAPQALKLVQAYYTHFAWLFNLIPEDEFSETIFNRVYAGPVASVADITPHDLGLLFVIFAVACLADPERPPYSAEGSNYYQLSRASLGLDSVIDHPTIQAVRAVHLLATFLQLCDHPNSATTCYSLMGLTAQLCHSLGLHRDDTEWNLSDRERHNRRNLFWEFASFNTWTSFALGRPASFSPAHVDAKVAADPERYLDSNGKWQISLRYWSHSFIQQVLFKVMDQAFGVTPPTYTTVMRLDRLVREHPLCEKLRAATETSGDPGRATELLLQRNALFALTQKLLLFLHRSFFADALMEHPEDPLKSRYAQSVLAAFRSAFYITTSVRAVYDRAPLSLRFWIYCTQSFSACLILGSVVIKSPGSSLAPPAWVELDRMYELFEQVAPQSRRIAHIMPELRKLRAKAHEAYTAFSTAPDGRPRPIDLDETAMQLLWGKTKTIVADKQHPSPPANTASSTSTAVPLPALPGSGSLTPSLISGTSLSSGPPQGLPTDGASNVPPADDLFAALYSSFFPPDAQPQQQFQQQQQQHYPLDLDTFAPMPIPAAQNDLFTHPPDWSGPLFDGMNAAPQWNDFDNVPMMSAPAATRNLDMPWQSFMDSIGMSDMEAPPPQPSQQHQQHQQQHGYGTGASGY